MFIRKYSRTTRIRFKKFNFLFVLLSLALVSTADNRQVDSLKQLLAKTTADTSRFKIIGNLFNYSLNNDTVAAKEFMQQLETVSSRLKIPRYRAMLHLVKGSYYEHMENFDSALEFYKKAAAEFHKADPNSVFEYKANNSVGTIFYYTAMYDSALMIFEKTTAIARKMGDKKIEARALSNIGEVNRVKGNFPVAVDFLLKSLKVAEQLQDTHSLIIVNGNISLLYRKMSQFGNAKKHAEEALRISESVDNLAGIADNLNTLGLICDDQGQFIESQEFFLRSLEINKKIGNQMRIAQGLNNMGLSYLKLKKPEQAREYFLQSLEMKKKFGDGLGLITTYTNLSNIEEDKKNLKTAIEFQLNATRVAKDIGASELLIPCYEALARQYGKIKKFEKAFGYSVLYASLKDSILSIKNSELAGEMEAKYENEKKQLQIDNLNKQKELNKKELEKKEEEVARQNTQKIAFASGFSLTLLLAFVSYRSYRRKQRDNIVITRQKQLVEEHQKETLDSIRYAKRIQYALLAGENLFKNSVTDFFVLFKPKDVVSGDFYWASAGPDGFMYITGDCTGHGVPGAFMSLLNISKLSQTINENKITRPDLVLNHVRSEIIKAVNPEGSTEESKDGMDAVLCRLDLKNMTLEYAAANNSFLIVRNGEIMRCKADKMPVGKGHDDSIPFTYNKIDLQKNDCIYTFTDGYADQFGGPKGKKFKYRQLEELIINISAESMEVQKTKLDEALMNWRGDLEQVDDVCVIGIRI